MKIVHFKSIGTFLAVVLFVTVLSASAQSLKPGNPYPLRSGVNIGTADSLIGTQYWYVWTNPGNSRITVKLRTPITLYGTELRNNSLTVTISDDKNTWRTSKVVTSAPNSNLATFNAVKNTKRVKTIIAVAPPSQQLIRMGGEYEIEVTGDVQFGDTASDVDPIVRTYSPMEMHYSDSYGAVKFLADGTVVTANGFTGTWKVFDRENRIYTIVLGRIRYSAQYLPGYGLVRPSDPSMIMFQELRR